MREGEGRGEQGKEREKGSENRGIEVQKGGCWCVRACVVGMLTIHSKVIT